MTERSRIGMKGVGIGGRLAPALLLLAVLATMMCAECLAAKKSYRYEDDPIRLGMKAIDEGRMEDARKHFDEAIENEHQVYRAHYGLGMILYRQGQYAEAEPLFRQSLIEKNQETSAEDYPEAHAALGLVLIRLQRPAEAKQEFTQALKEKGSLWEAQYGMARILIDEKNYDEAEKYLEKGSKKKGLIEGADLYQYGEALVKHAKGDLAGAEKNALAAFTINPNDPEYGTLVAEIYTKRGARSLAIDAYRTALNTPGLLVAAPVHERLGRLLEEEKQYNDALREYQEAVKIDSTYAPAVKQMAQLYALANRNEEAAIAYTSYARLRRDDPQAFRGLAEACLKTNRFRQAYEAAQQAFALDSASVEVRLTLARAAFQSRERGRAAELYESVPDTIRLEPADYVKQGQIKLEAKRYDEANEDLLRAVKMDSTLADAWFGLGLKDLQTGQPDSALIHFEKATALAPTSSGAWLNKGIALMQLKRNGEAVVALREAVRLSPDYAPARIYLAQAILADAGTDEEAVKGVAQAASVEYKTVLEKEPQNTMALRGLGYCYIRMKRFETAVATLKQTTEIEPDNPEGWYMLGQAYGSAGNLTAGIAAEEKALQINPQHEGAKRVLEILRSAASKQGGN